MRKYNITILLAQLRACARKTRIYLKRSWGSVSAFHNLRLPGWSAASTTYGCRLWLKRHMPWDWNLCSFQIPSSRRASFGCEATARNRLCRDRPATGLLAANRRTAMPKSDRKNPTVLEIWLKPDTCGHNSNLPYDQNLFRFRR